MTNQIHYYYLHISEISATKFVAKVSTATASAAALQKVRNFLISQLKYLHQVSCQTAILIGIKETGRFTIVAYTTSSTYTMDVFIDALWQVIVDDMRNVFDI